MQLCRTSFSIYLKKDFHHKFYFFNKFTPPTYTTPLINGQNLLAKCDDSFFLMFPKSYYLHISTIKVVHILNGDI